MTSQNTSKQRGGIANKSGSSHHTFGVSSGAIPRARLSSAPKGKETPCTQTSRSKSALPGQSSRSLKGAESASRGEVEHHAKKPAWTNEDAKKEKAEWKKEKAEWEKEKAELEKEKAEWEKEKTELEKAKANLQRSLEKEKHNVEETKLSLGNEIKEIKERHERELHQAKTKWDNDYKTLNKSHTKEKKLLHNTIESLKTEKNNLLTRLEEEKNKVKEIERKLENNIKEIQQKKDKECESLRKRLHELEQCLSKTEEDNKTCHKSYEKLQQDKERELDQSKKELKELSDTHERMKAEKDSLMTRLSKIAADRLTHGNVNIADLSDADRPTKLQEVYSELYDNEWTDAYEELTEHQNVPEKDAIRILLNIIMSSFQKCREITWGRYERLIYVASSIDIGQISSLSSAEKVKQEEQSSRTQLDKKGAQENQNADKVDVELSDPSMNGVLKDKFGIGKETNAAIENVELVQTNVTAAPKGKFENEEEKNVGNNNVVFGDQNVTAALKEELEDETKNAAKENLVFVDPDVSGRSKDKFEHGKGKRLDLGLDLMHTIKDIWRETTLAMKVMSVQQIYSVIETCLDKPVSAMPMTSKYLSRCIDLCWKMGVQEMPLHLDSDGSRNEFDQNKFRAYTESGRNVAFVVWPALYLYEGGPMLVKGIAQGCSSSGDEEQNIEIHS